MTPCYSIHVSFQAVLSLRNEIYQHLTPDYVKNMFYSRINLDVYPAIIITLCTAFVLFLSCKSSILYSHGSAFVNAY